MINNEELDLINADEEIHGMYERLHDYGRDPDYEHEDDYEPMPLSDKEFLELMKEVHVLASEVYRTKPELTQQQFATLWRRTSWNFHFEYDRRYYEQMRTVFYMNYLFLRLLENGSRNQFEQNQSFKKVNGSHLRVVK